MSVPLVSTKAWLAPCMVDTGSLISTIATGMSLSVLLCGFVSLQLFNERSLIRVTILMLKDIVIVLWTLKECNYVGKAMQKSHVFAKDCWDRWARQQRLTSNPAITMPVALPSCAGQVHVGFIDKYWAAVGAFVATSVADQALSSMQQCMIGKLSLCFCVIKCWHFSTCMLSTGIARLKPECRIAFIFGFRSWMSEPLLMLVSFLHDCE